MLKKENRLLVFKPVKGGRSIGNSLFRIKVFSDNNKNTQFGFVVSKKIDKRAVVRNKTKRVLKKSVKNLLDKITIGYRIVVIARQKLEFNQEDLVTKQFNQDFKKLKIIK